MALGADISLGGEHRGPVSSIPAADMIAAFRYVFGAAAAHDGAAALCMMLMEERPLAGPPQAGRRWRSRERRQRRAAGLVGCGYHSRELI